LLKGDRNQPKNLNTSQAIGHGLVLSAVLVAKKQRIGQLNSFCHKVVILSPYNALKLSGRRDPWVNALIYIIIGEI
jgi:hypothetical protein